MSRLFVLTDLDDTLFQTRRRRDPGADARVAALDRDGSPLSFQCARQQALFDALDAAGTIIPVTARTTRALARVTLPFRSWRVAACGAVVLRPDGTEDPAWRAHAGARAEAALPALREAARRLDTALAGAGLDARSRLLEDMGRPAYTCVKLADGADRVAAVAGLGELEGVAVWCTEETVTVAAAGLGKADAVAFLAAERLPEGAVLLGFGDSAADQGFLRLTHYAAWPALNAYTARWRDAR